uniref:Uncharacterized protein n=1 Tax=Megaselia scalaris TaxID=36166 RepID=T1GA23_MEGSC
MNHTCHESSINDTHERCKYLFRSLPSNSMFTLMNLRKTINLELERNMFKPLKKWIPANSSKNLGECLFFYENDDPSSNSSTKWRDVLVVERLQGPIGLKSGMIWEISRPQTWRSLTVGHGVF